MKDIKSFILFQALTALISGHALLQSANSPSTQTQVFFYSVLLAMNWISLILIYIYYQEDYQFVDYNENLTKTSLPLIIAAIIGVYFAAAVISRPWTTSALYIPTFAQRLVLDLTHFDFTVFITVLLYNYALIANSEETTKLVGHNALYLYFVGRYPNRLREVKIACVVFPIAFWAVLHAYIAYVGLLVLQLVFAAFISGLIIFFALWKTKSILAAIIVHGTYNVIVLTATGLGLLMLSPAVLMVLIAYALANLVLITLAIRQKTQKS